MYTYSIIIPHKNIPVLLERCLESIPVRDDIQVIIIDDNSDSDIVDFTNFPGKGRLNTEIYLTKEGKGAGYARNVGLKKARGRWLLFADADDFYNEDFLKELDKYKDTDNDVIYFLADSIDSTTLKAAERHLYLVKTREKYNKKVRYNKINFKDELVYKNWEAWSKMFRRNFIERNSLFFEETKIGEDALFVIRAGELSDKYAVDDFPLYCITYRADSLCFTIDDECDFNERFKAKIRINRYLKEVGKHKFRSDLDKDILMAYSYGGIQKMREAIKTAEENTDKVRFKTYIRYYYKIIKKYLS